MYSYFLNETLGIYTFYWMSYKLHFLSVTLRKNVENQITFFIL